ncbi:MULTISPECIES: phage portal protein [unclassified Maridesulfovibrio]|uniref:phage portal protein n=1 Tax=unclassified Maridesulfovibrio TaxID=2794999 RepID=UPI003B40EE3A
MTMSLRKVKQLQAKARGNAVRPVRFVGGGNGSTLGNWHPQRQSRGSERLDREKLQSRIEDVVANDGHAESIRGTLTTNIVGPGLKAQSNLAAQLLNLTPEQVAKIERAQNTSFELWAKEAHVSGKFQWADIQALTISGQVSLGEFCYLCRYFDEITRIRKGRNFSFALQDIHPIRLRTPDTEVFDGSIRDGVVFDSDSEIIGYYIHNPADLNEPESYCYYPARNGHLPKFFHGFRAKRFEQVRGDSIFAPVIKLFRDKYDFLDYEVIAQIITASFPIAIEQTFPPDTADFKVDEKKGRYYQDINPGQVFYGNAGEKITALSSDRPGNNFDPFFKMILKTLSAAAGVPYHQVIKDFSETNYSSARAALLESWREFQCYRDWLVRLFLQKVREIVIEEAWLRGMWSIPEGCPDFYEARELWTACKWTPPAKGHIDEDKEAKANERKLATNQISYEAFFAEQGLNWETEFEKMARERKRAKKLGLPLPESSTMPISPDEPEEDDEKNKAGAA